MKDQLIPHFIGADPTIAGYPTAPDPSVVSTNAGGDPDVGSYNAELLKQLSPAMKAKMQALFPSL